jgi:nucleolar GTP-binding protein
MTMSNTSEKGVSEVKAAACDKLLAARVDSRISTKKVDGIMNRIQVFYPKPRDNVKREAFIPQSVLKAIEDGTFYKPDHKAKRSNTGYALTVNDDIADTDHENALMIDNPTDKKTARDLMWENGGPGVWAPDYRCQYDLKNDEWKFDEIPQIVDGKNIADYYDPDIEEKLAALEEEEQQLLDEMEAGAFGQEEESDLDSEEEAAVAAIRDNIKIARIKSHTNRSQNKSMMPREVRGRSKDKHDPGVRNTSEIAKTMEKFGIDASKMIERGRKRERSLDTTRSRGQRESADKDEDMTDAFTAEGTTLSKGQTKKMRKEKDEIRKREASLARSHSRPRTPSQVGLKNEEAVAIAKKKEKLGRSSWEGMAGEGDHRKTVSLVKWMNTGKRRGQKTSTIGR